MSFIYTALLFAVVEPITGHILEPLLYGKSTGLSPVAIVVSAVVWSFLWGPIGLVLAIPLTICLVVVGCGCLFLQFGDLLAVRWMKKRMIRYQIAERVCPR